MKCLFIVVSLFLALSELLTGVVVLSRHGSKRRAVFFNKFRVFNMHYGYSTALGSTKWRSFINTTAIASLSSEWTASIMQREAERMRPAQEHAENNCITGSAQNMQTSMMAAAICVPEFMSGREAGSNASQE